jgi:hypothetical protein
MADASTQNLPVIDWQAAVTLVRARVERLCVALLTRVCGWQCEDESFLIELLTDFIQESRTHLTSLEGFIAEGNAKVPSARGRRVCVYIDPPACGCNR